MNYLANAFSLNMVRRSNLAAVRLRPSLAAEWSAYKAKGAVSIVGHADTAALLGVTCNRQSVTLQPGDVLIVAQYVGPRLPEGTTTLPEGARFDFVRVTL